MKFSELALFIEKIEKTSSRLEITNILAELFKKLDAEEIGKTVYLLQGRVSPIYEGIESGMAEKMVVKAAVSSLNLDKSYFEKELKKIGDLGKTVELFKKQYSSFEEKDLTVLEVFDGLYKLSVSGGKGSQDVKINILSLMIRQLNPLSANYLVRIPTGLMRLGFSDMTVLDAFSWMIKGDKSLRPVIERAYHVRPDLGNIGRLIKKDGIKTLEKIGPLVFTPIIMMRAERLSSAAEIIKQIGKCAVEPKYDGFRLQVHYINHKSQITNHKQISNNKLQNVKLYSRNLEDVTNMYPDIVEGVKKEIIANEVIFEGEAIGVNPKTGEFLPFQETVQRKRKYEIAEKTKEIPLKFFSFELLYKDGKNFIHEPFSIRRQELVKTIKNPNKGIILTAPEKIISDEKILDSMFDEAVNDGLEGIIAKKLNGIYQPGARGWNWIKFKRSYSSKINDTIDCLIMGYDFGKGKRTGFGIGAFLVGIYDDKKDKFLTVAKIGTGLSDEEWKQLKSQSIKYKVPKKPNEYLVEKQMGCDIWLLPRIVVEIKADEITRSPIHTAHLALRFPRLERFRDDKSPEGATTLTEIQKIFKAQ